MTETYDDTLDKVQFTRLMREELESTQRILHALSLATETPTILLARQLYSERLTRIRAAIENFTTIRKTPAVP